MNTQYREYGKQNREVIVLLHGGGLSWWNYRAEAELLADRFHVVLPILDGHAGSGAPFESIEKSAERLIAFIDASFGGSVLLMGGLSLGAQVLVEALTRRPEICRYAIIESASVIPSPVTGALIGSALASSYFLIRKRWFARLQFRSLHIRQDLFEDYYRDTCQIARGDMTAFLKANSAYGLKAGLSNCLVRARIIVGGRESRRMRRSAARLKDALPGSGLEIKAGLCHGEFAINYPDSYVREVLGMVERSGEQGLGLGSRGLGPMQFGVRSSELEVDSRPGSPSES